MTADRWQQNTVAVFITLTTAVAAALLMGYDTAGWVKGALGYVAWALVPYVLVLGLLLAIRANRLGALSGKEATWSYAIVAAAGPLLYFDIRFMHPDAQGAIAMLMAPILQCAGIGLFSAIALFWHRLQHNKPNRMLLLLNKSVMAAFLIYLVVSALQYSDAKTIDAAKEADFFIQKYCEAHGVLPSVSKLHTRFSGLITDAGWFFYTDNATWLKMQYPVSWRNSHAPGKPQISEFTATVYSYIVEYRCGVSR